MVRRVVVVATKERERSVHANRQAAFRLSVKSICQLSAEKLRVCGNAIM
jgi:hypothetical protein